MSEIKTLVENIIADGVIDKEEYSKLLKAFQSDGVIDSEEKSLIEQVYQRIKNGELKIEE